MNHTHALKTAFENLILVEANWVVCWHGLLIRSLEACFHPAAFCCSISSQLEPAFGGISCLSSHHTGRTTAKVSASLWGKTPHANLHLPKTKRQNCSQPLFHPWRVKTSPPVTVRLGGSSKLTTGQWSKIHKSPPRRQRREGKGDRESRIWQCESRDWTGINRFDFHCSWIQEVSFPISSQEAEHRCRGGDKWGPYCWRWWPEWQRGGVGPGQEGSYLEHKG